MITALRLTLFLFLISVSSTIFSQEYLEYNHNGQIRNFIYYAPDNLPPNAPLVFVLHGYTSNANNIMGYSEMNKEADENGFAVCYPFGLQDNFGVPHWNANLTISNVDDIGFLSELATHLQATYNLDAERTFSCGMSNGGFMSYTLACEKPDVFKAIASVTGTMSGYDWENCDPDNVIPVMQISGTDDNTVPIDGSITTFGGWGGAPGMDAVRDFWVDLNECQESIEFVIDANYTTYHTIYYNDINDNEVWHYLIEGWGHYWPITISGTGFTAAKQIWLFFSLVSGETTSISESGDETTRLNIYPNPSNGIIYLNSDIKSGSEYHVFSMDGLKMGSGQIGSHQEVDLSHLPGGMYVLHVNGKNKKLLIMD